MMKKITILCAIFSMLILTSCSTDDNSNNNVNNTTSLIGDWEYVDVYYEGQQTIDFQGQPLTMDFTGQSVSFDNAILTFNNDNTYEGSGSYAVDLTLDFMGQQQTQTTESMAFFGSGTWAVNGNTMTVTSDETSESGDLNIEILNATTLKLTVDNYTTSVANPQGGTMDVEVDYELTFEKI